MTTYDCNNLLDDIKKAFDNYMPNNDLRSEDRIKRQINNARSSHNSRAKEAGLPKANPKDFTVEDYLILLDTNNSKCVICQQDFITGNELFKPEIAHIKPPAEGGDFSMENIYLAHSRCQKIAGDNRILPLSCNINAGNITVQNNNKTRHIQFNRKASKRFFFKSIVDDLIDFFR